MLRCSCAVLCEGFGERVWEGGLRAGWVHVGSVVDGAWWIALAQKFYEGCAVLRIEAEGRADHGVGFVGDERVVLGARALGSSVWRGRPLVGSLLLGGDAQEEGWCLKASR